MGGRSEEIRGTEGPTADAPLVRQGPRRRPRSEGGGKGRRTRRHKTVCGVGRKDEWQILAGGGKVQVDNVPCQQRRWGAGATKR